MVSSIRTAGERSRIAGNAAEIREHRGPGRRWVEGREGFALKFKYHNGGRALALRPVEHAGPI